MTHDPEISKKERSKGRSAAKLATTSVVVQGTAVGTVKFFNMDKGYGFIQPEDAQAEGFVHISDVEHRLLETSLSRGYFPERTRFRDLALASIAMVESDDDGKAQGATDDVPTPRQPDEAARLALLDHAASETNSATDPLERLNYAIRAEAAELLGGPAVMGRVIGSETDLLVALVQGFPSGVLVALRESGLPHSALELVIAPRRTLMRRKAEGQRLTRAESDSTWRLAHLLALATHVLDGRKAAIDWLMRGKLAFANNSPVDLAETSVGAAHVERLLRRLEWGDVA